MKLNLNNPVVFFDLETTGINITTDRIVELCYIKVYPNGNEESKSMRINPEMHIPESSSAIHGIYDEDVADCPTFKQVARELANTIKGCDFAGFNSNRFDVPMLVEEFLRAGIDIDIRKRKFIDVQNIYHKLERRTLSAAYKFYCGKDLENAHSALADTRATYEVLMAQLDHYPEDLKNDVAFPSDFSRMTWILPDAWFMMKIVMSCSTSANTKEKKSPTCYVRIPDITVGFCKVTSHATPSRF